MFEKTLNRYYDGLFNKRCDDPGYNKYYTYLDFEGVKEEKFSFLSRKNNVLRGGLYFKGGSVDEYDRLIIFFHGMSCGYLAYMNEINMLVQAGFLVLAYDYTATFSSDGDSLEGFGRPLADFEDALKAIKADPKLKDKRLSLMGHSWGGYTALNALNLCDGIEYAVCVSPPVSYEAIIRSAFPGLLGLIIKKHVLKYEEKIFGDLIYLSGVSAAESKTKVLYIYSLDDPVVKYKYNFAEIEKKDHNPLHKRIVFTDRTHFPLMTDSAVKKLNARHADLNKWISQGKSPQEIKKLSENVPWDDLVEQDKALWDKIIAFLNE